MTEPHRFQARARVRGSHSFALTPGSKSHIDPCSSRYARQADPSVPTSCALGASPAARRNARSSCPSRPGKDPAGWHPALQTLHAFPAAQAAQGMANRCHCPC